MLLSPLTPVSGYNSPFLEICSVNPSFLSPPVPPLSISQGVNLFKERVEFSSETSTKRTYLTALKTWMESLASNGIDVNSFSLHDLQSSMVVDYISWLSQSKQLPKAKAKGPQNTPRFRSPTIHLYVSALVRAVNFWRNEGFILFSKDSERDRRDASHIGSKSDAGSRSRADLVDENFGDLMLSKVFSIRLPSPSRKIRILGCPASAQRSSVFYIQPRCGLAMPAGSRARISPRSAPAEEYCGSVRRKPGIGPMCLFPTSPRLR